MSYIGIPPQANFSSGLLDRFTSTTGTTVTLTHDIASENDIVVFVNFVKQDSTTYSVSGTGNKTLTLGGTLVSSDIVEVHYLNIVGQTNAPSSGSVGSSQLSADIITGQTALATTPSDTDEFLISDSGTLKRIDFTHIKGAGAGESNDASFHAYNPQNGNIATSTNVVISNNTELFDSSSAYDTSNYRFTPQVAGYYFLYANIRYQSSTTNFDRINLVINKNGSAILGARNNNRDYATAGVSGIVQANGSSDYFDVRSYQNSGLTMGITTADEYTYFGGFLIKKT